MRAAEVQEKAMTNKSFLSTQRTQNRKSRIHQVSGKQ